MIELKKILLASFLIFCLSFILFVMGCKVSIDAVANVIYVPTQSATIQGAINQAKPGDTIFVHKGTYYENVVVNKSVALVGEDRDSTIVDGRGVGSVISVLASNVDIRGFLIANSTRQPLNSGITIRQSSGDDISGNKIINCYDGVSLLSSGNNMISSNVIYSNNQYGISLYISSNNVVLNNAIYTNAQYGIYLAPYSVNNIIYHNNFNNTQQAWCSLQNIWDYEGEGNYWSDYQGQDLNRDAIGDTSYAIAVNGKDNYPLMGMFSGFSVTSKRQTYNVTVISNSTISDFKFELGAETGSKIIRFNVSGEEGTPGFSRVTIPTDLMNNPFITLFDEEEIVPTVRNVSKDSRNYTYLYLTYTHSSYTITIVSSKMLQLYNELLGTQVRLNTTYYDLLKNYGVLLGNYSQLQESYRGLNNSYQELLQDNSENVNNIRNLTYIFAATSAIFIITTIYLSRTRARRE